MVFNDERDYQFPSSYATTNMVAFISKSVPRIMHHLLPLPQSLPLPNHLPNQPSPATHPIPPQTTTKKRTSSVDTYVDRVGKIGIKMKVPKSIVATRGPSEEVYIWDLSKHSSFPLVAPATPSPNVICRGTSG
mmetsp:Transcript_9711/g.21899  ORF Transcript_9711/g.21899 Transcript_9711/m.21899 type:complete len:133 (+) Transcript_9711:642-1040(+)